MFNLSKESIKISKLIEHGELSLKRAIELRWCLELKSGVINFNPINKSQYKEKRIGKFLKRIIPDRILGKGESMNDCKTPVFVYFKNNKDFNYNKTPKSQELFRIKIKNLRYRFFVSNSPLSYSPHLLLVPFHNRSQFIRLCDIETIFNILKDEKEFVFLYSSMGAGAGVNHMHIHLIAGREPFPVMSAEKKIFFEKKGYRIEKFKNWPSDSYMFSGNTKKIIENSYKFIKFLQKNNVPHNIFIQKEEVWINPRDRIFSKIMPNKKFGSWEVILGIFNACSVAEYNYINGINFESILTEIKIRGRLKKRIECMLAKL